MKEITRIEVGQVGVKPGTVKMVTSDNLSTITTAGYLTQASAVGGISQNDIIQAIYSFNGTSGTFGLFTVSISDGVITLAQAALVADGSITAAKLASNAVTTAKILDSNVTLEKLATGITPSHVIKFAGRHTTVGGSATENITVTGVLATDNVSVSIRTAGATPRTIVSQTTSSNTVTVVFSDDPSNDHVIYYEVTRAAS